MLSVRTGILAALFLVVTLFPILHAANESASLDWAAVKGIEGQSQFIFPEGEMYSIENFSLEGKTLYGVSSPQSGILAIFSSDPADGTAKPLIEAAQIEPALAAYYLSKGYDPEAVKDLESVHKGFRGIRENRKSGEAECFRLMGMEGRPCDGDFELCKAYCIGTPFCNNFAYGGELGEFIRVIIEFENLTLQLDKAYENEETAYEALSKGADKDTVSAYLASIGGVNRAVTKVSSSSLFYGYSFCFTPDYELPTITALQLSAQNDFRLGSPFLTLAQSADNIRNRTLDGMAAKAAHEAAQEAARIEEERIRNETLLNQTNASASANATGNASAPKPGPEKPQAPVFEYALLVGAAALFLAACAAFYILKMRGKAYGKKSAAFEKAEIEIRKGKR